MTIINLSQKVSMFVYHYVLYGVYNDSYGVVIWELRNNLKAVKLYSKGGYSGLLSLALLLVLYLEGLTILMFHGLSK